MVPRSPFSTRVEAATKVETATDVLSRFLLSQGCSDGGRKSQSRLQYLIQSINRTPYPVSTHPVSVSSVTVTCDCDCILLYSTAGVGRSSRWSTCRCRCARGGRVRWPALIYCTGGSSDASVIRHACSRYSRYRYTKELRPVSSRSTSACRCSHF